MATKSIEERIDELQKKQAQLKAQEKALKAKKSQTERKARTKRLIEVGAILEKAMNVEFKTQEERDRLLHLLTDKRISNNNNEFTYGLWLEDQYKKQQ